ncbi:MAG TPA: hypothetical protein VJ978_13425 [Nitriliruptoraceae bacterium]|nr:hypothetical protein [Nitriliruptoraceae bacterium]
MVNKPVIPDADIRELRKDYKALMKAEGEERADELAKFARRAHVMRQINMAMHTGQLALDEDPDAPDLLVGAYLGDQDTEDTEQGLHDLLDLVDIGRWLDRDDIADLATQRFDTHARDWVSGANAAEARHRLRLLAGMKDRGYADSLRDELRFG